MVKKLSVLHLKYAILLQRKQKYKAKGEMNNEYKENIFTERGNEKIL